MKMASPNDFGGVARFQAAAVRRASDGKKQPDCTCICRICSWVVSGEVTAFWGTSDVSELKNRDHG